MAVEPLGTIMTYQSSMNKSYGDNYTQRDYTPHVENNQVNPNMYDKENLRIVDNPDELSNNMESFNRQQQELANVIKTYIDKRFKNTSAQFSFHKDCNRVAIKIIDTKTHDVIKEIPPEEVLDALAKRIELEGSLFDKRG
jgi:flagellar protein FlaG